MKDVFNGQGLVIDGLVFLSPKEAYPFLERDAILVDLRSGLGRNGREFQVNDVILLPFAELEARLEVLPRDRLLILADYVGLRSKAAVKLLTELGYESVASLNGGMVAWLESGLPTTRDLDAELTGQCACKLRPSKVYRTGC